MRIDGMEGMEDATVVVVDSCGGGPAVGLTDDGTVTVFALRVSGVDQEGDPITAMIFLAEDAAVSFVVGVNKATAGVFGQPFMRRVAAGLWIAEDDE